MKLHEKKKSKVFKGQSFYFQVTLAHTYMLGYLITGPGIGRQSGDCTIIKSSKNPSSHVTRQPSQLIKTGAAELG